jgi:CO/xanthine dehydrogenase Mo-binding subunit
VAGQSWGCGALVKINDDGTANLLTGEGDCGQGARTLLAQICAEELGVPLDDVWASLADTDFAPYCPGPLSSRTTPTAGNAVRLAAADAKRQLILGAAEKLDVRPEDLETRDRRIYVRSNPELSVSYAEAAMAPSFRPIMGRGVFIPTQSGSDVRTWYGDSATSYSFTSQIAEVEVDTETGEVEFLNLTGAYDLGRAINPSAAEGQAEGGASFAMGWAMTENLEPVKGQIIGNQFTDYKVPNTLDMPEVEPILVETNDPVCPFGAKGVGEVVGVPTAAAIANAIYDAVGIRMRELPITPEKVLRALKEKSES